MNADEKQKGRNAWGHLIACIRRNLPKKKISGIYLRHLRHLWIGSCNEINIQGTKARKKDKGTWMCVISSSWAGLKPAPAASREVRGCRKTKCNQCQKRNLWSWMS